MNRKRMYVWIVMMLTLSFQGMVFAQPAPAPAPAPAAAPAAPAAGGGEANPASDDDDAASSASLFATFFWPGDFVGIAITWLLIIMSIGSIGLVITYALRARRSQLLPDDLYEELQELIETKKFREAIEISEEEESYLGKLTHAALVEAGNGYTAMERAIEEVGDAETTRSLRPVEFLNVLGNVSPMMGLFGTVYGMIVAFMTLVEQGGTPDPAELAAGISTALVTTLWGLVVAIPAIAAYSLIRNKIDALTSEGMLMVEELIVPFKPGKRSSSSRPRATPKPDTAGE